MSVPGGGGTGGGFPSKLGFPGIGVADISSTSEKLQAQVDSFPEIQNPSRSNFDLSVDLENRRGWKFELRRSPHKHPHSICLRCIISGYMKKTEISSRLKSE